MIGLEEVLEIHRILINAYGGTHGIPDEGALKSAIERPYSGFGNEEFYPNPQDKAAAILESVVNNHPFIDGNKRTGYVLMRMILLQAGLDILATQNEKFNLVIGVASGKIDYPIIKEWIDQRLIQNKL